jgi:hypothetical protein
MIDGARSWQKCSSGGELSTFCSLPFAAARDRGAHRQPWTYRLVRRGTMVPKIVTFL